MRITKSDQLTTELIEELLEIWEASVKFSHDFLRSEDVEEIKKEVKPALQNVVLYLAHEESDGKIIGFLGLSTNKIEMLFLSPAYIGKGYGKKLIECAMADGAIFVDVNEQNIAALKFYKKIGFKIIKRNEQDEQGRNFPILNMKLDVDV